MDETVAFKRTVAFLQVKVTAKLNIIEWITGTSIFNGETSDTKKKIKKFRL